MTLNPKFCEWTNWFLLDEYQDMIRLLSHDRDASSYRFTLEEIQAEILTRMAVGVR